MKDATGRQVSSLTAADEQLLGQAHMVFDQLCDELDMRNNRNEEVTNLVRRRNYTVFFGYCLNKWNTDSRTPDRQNFCGLFVSTAKGFISAVQDNITERTLMNNGDNSWLPSVYNRSLTGRDGFLMFSVNQNKLQAGYVVTASHEVGRAKNLEGVVISEEDAELMVDPVETFLGWQANRDENAAPGTKRLFNAALTQEAITFMTEQLAAIRMAKSTGITIADAIQATNAKALEKQNYTTTTGQATNDPMLAEMAAKTDQENTFSQTVDPSKLVNNDAPYQTPPVSHIDPMTNAPKTNPWSNPSNNFGQQNPAASQNSAPFQPSFGSNFANGNNGMPF
jgi:hypothetical protein